MVDWEQLKSDLYFAFIIIVIFGLIFGVMALFLYSLVQDTREQVELCKTIDSRIQDCFKGNRTYQCFRNEMEYSNEKCYRYEKHWRNDTYDKSKEEI